MEGQGQGQNAISRPHGAAQTGSHATPSRRVVASVLRGVGFDVLPTYLRVKHRVPIRVIGAMRFDFDRSKQLNKHPVGRVPRNEEVKAGRSDGSSRMHDAR